MDIKKCCICGNKVESKFQIAFEDLLGAKENIYCQKIGLCKHCGYIFTQNPFTKEQLDNRYKNVSKFEYDSKDYVLDNDYKERSIRQKHFLMENIDFSSIHSLFEVGAASGYNLSLYKSYGIQIIGVEPSSVNCRNAKSIYDIQLFNGMFDEYYTKQQGNQKFDIVFLSMVLEHIVDPLTFILQCKNLCNNYIFIEVPTLDLRHSEEPMGIFAEEHVSLFTLDSLNSLMVKAGFRLINAENAYGFNQYIPAAYPSIVTLWQKSDIQSMSMRYNIFSSEELLEKYIIESFKVLKVVRDKIDAIPSHIRLAVWGVGHHASMLLANTNLKEKNIVRVYDSDKRKSGLSFAGIEITVFSEFDLQANSIEAILLTTYTAQKAILKYIKNQVVNCPVITLYDL